MTEEIACPECGGAVEVRREGGTQGIYCTQCDWCAVTTWLPEILRDQAHYVMAVTSGDFKNPQHLRAIAHLLETNWLAARKLLQSGEAFPVFSGAAYRVTKVRSMLLDNGLAFRITPPFPW